MNQIKEAAQEGRLLEAFGAGTAAVVAPIRNIHYKGEDIAIPLQEGKEAGEIAEKLHKWVVGIQYGEEAKSSMER